MSALTQFRRVFLAALLAALCAGVVGWAARQVAVVPLILRAEVYEQAAHDARPHDSHGQDEDAAWRPAEGLERALFTLFTDLFAALAFALILNAVILLAGARIDVWRGLAWGLGGYVAVSLVPSLYLPPELPGTDSGALHARQAWWLFAVMATAAGLLLVRFAPRPAWYAMAVLLIALPHLVGAPVSHGAEVAGAPPAELAHRFIVAVLAANAVFWLALGAATGFFQSRLLRGGYAA